MNKRKKRSSNSRPQEIVTMRTAKKTTSLYVNRVLNNGDYKIA